MVTLWQLRSRSTYKLLKKKRKKVGLILSELRPFPTLVNCMDKHNYSEGHSLGHISSHYIKR